MQLQLALVCDEVVETPEGKLDLKGVFNDLAAPGFPAKHDMFLVLAVEWGRTDQGKYDFQVDLLDPAGRPTMTIRGHSDVDRRESERPPAHTRIIQPLKDVIFPEAGQYQFQIQLKGRTLPGPSLFLVEAEPVGDAAG